MKRLLVIITAVLLCMTSVFTVAAERVTAENEKVSINLPDVFTAVTDAPADVKAQKDFIGTLGHSVSSFSAFLKDNGICIFAATPDNQRQVQFKSYTTEFSSELQELSALLKDEQSLGIVAEKMGIVAENETLKGMTQIKTADGRLYIKTEKTVSGTSADYSCMQYVTITGGKYYMLVYYNFGGEFTDAQLDELGKIFESVSLPDGSFADDEKDGGVLVVVVGVLMAAAVIFTIAAAVSLIVEMVKRRNNSDVDDIKIKRRHLK